MVARMNVYITHIYAIWDRNFFAAFTMALTLNGSCSTKGLNKLAVMTALTPPSNKLR